VDGVAHICSLEKSRRDLNIARTHMRRSVFAVTCSVHFKFVEASGVVVHRRSIWTSWSCGNTGWNCEVLTSIRQMSSVWIRLILQVRADSRTVRVAIAAAAHRTESGRNVAPFNKRGVAGWNFSGVTLHLAGISVGFA